MPLNFDLAGKTYDSVTSIVDPEAVAAYAAASGDTNPRYQIGEGQIASPLFPVVLGLPLMGAVTTDPDLNVENPLMIVHGEEEIIYRRPLVAGEELVLTPQLTAVEDKGRGAVYIVTVRAADSSGETVNTQNAAIFVRGAGSGVERPASAKPEPPQRDNLVATVGSHVDVEMPSRYAPASGDHNPIHLDDAVAKAVGLPGVINHGLGTMSLVTGDMVDEVLGGDPSRIRRLKVRFTDMVIPGSDLSTAVWSTSGGYLFETTRGDESVVMSGIMEVAAY